MVCFIGKIMSGKTNHYFFISIFVIEITYISYKQNKRKGKVL